MPPGRSSPWRSANSASCFRDRAGSSTTPWKSGKPSLPRRARPSPRPAYAATDIAAIGITNQRETTVVWNRKTGEPLVQRHRLAGPAHRRGLRDACRARLTDKVRERTGLVIDAYFSGHQAGLDPRQRCPAHGPPPAGGELAFGTIDSWLLWQLTGGAVTPPMSATPRAPAVRHPPQPVGRRTAGHVRHSARGVCPKCIPPAIRSATRVPTSSAHPSPSAASPATSRARFSARPAFPPGWRRTPTAPAASCCCKRRSLPGQQQRPDQHQRGAGRQQGTVRAGGQRLHRRRRGAMAARRPASHRSQRAKYRALPKAFPTAAA
jgi:hypothetical protein